MGTFAHEYQLAVFLRIEHSLGIETFLKLKAHEAVCMNLTCYTFHILGAQSHSLITSCRAFQTIKTNTDAVWYLQTFILLNLLNKLLALDS